MNSPAVRLLVVDGVLDRVVAHSKACLPEEACGFLVGRGDAAERFVPARNALRSSKAFSVEPQFLSGLFRSLRLSGERMVAVVHSHPSAPAVLSEQDLAQAHYPDAVQLIVSLAGPDPEIRAYRVAGGEVLEVELHAIV
jgi:proteasome lid subunit RPN8/RPN11